MTFEKPAWITKEFVQNFIQNGNNSFKVLIESFDVEMPVAEGNNYGSDIFGVKVKYRKSNDLDNIQETSVIIKGQVNGSISDMLVDSGATEKEAMVYKELAPKLESIFSLSDKIQEDNYIFPKSYFSPEANAIILEDLKCKGYKMADKLKGLDFDHCAAAFIALAKFHAGCILIQEKEPALIEKLSKEIMTHKSVKEWFSNLLKTTFRVFAEEFDKLPRFQKYSRWFKENSERTYDLLINNMTKCKESELKVLNHGDFWLTNMLFRTEDNEPPKIKLIDLQCCRYTSPAVDFLNLMDTSVQEQVREEKFDELMKIYLNEFNTILEQRGNSKRLEESEFRKSIADRPFYRIYLSTFCLSLILADPKEVKILNREEFTQDIAINEETTPTRDYIKNERYLKIIEKRLLEFEESGVISFQ